MNARVGVTTAARAIPPAGPANVPQASSERTATPVGGGREWKSEKQRQVV